MINENDKIMYKGHKGFIERLDNKTYSITAYIIKTIDGFNMICFNENEIIKEGL